MLQMKISLVHSASTLTLMLHVFAKSVSAPQNCSHDSRFLCLRFGSLYLSNVVLGGLLNAVSSNVQNSVNEKATIFTRGFFWAKTLFPSLPIAKNKIHKNGFVLFHCVLVPRLSFGSVCVLLASCGLLQNRNLRFWSVETICVQIFFRNYRQLKLVAPLGPGTRWL